MLNPFALWIVDLFVFLLLVTRVVLYSIESIEEDGSSSCSLLVTCFLHAFVQKCVRRRVEFQHQSKQLAVNLEQLGATWKLSDVCTLLCFWVLLLRTLLLWFHGGSGLKRGASRGGRRGSFTKEDYVKYFRMSKGTFLYLCQELRHTISRHDTQMRKVLPCEMRVAITLWQLGTNDSYRAFRHLFSASRSSVCYIVKEVCQAIVSKLLLIYIRIPDALKEVVR